MNTQDTQRETIVRVMAVMAVIFTTVIVFGKAIDNDMWFILNHGRYITNNGFTDTEPFTIHENLEFSFEKWLFCVLCYRIWCFGGERGIIAVFTILAIILILMIYGISYSISGLWGLSLSISLISLALLKPFLNTRPQMVTYIVFLLEIYLLEKYTDDGKYRHIVFIPFLSVLLMQLHSTQWVIMLIAILPYLCVKPEKREKIKGYVNRNLPLYVAFIATFLAGFINPYGVRSVIYIVNSLKGMPKNVLVSEVKPLSFDKSIIFGIVLITILPIIIGAIKGRLNFKSRHTLMFLGYLFMAFWAIRNVSYLILACIFLYMRIDKGYLIAVNKYITDKVYPIFILAALVLVYYFRFYSAGDNEYYAKTYGKECSEYVSNLDGSEDFKVYTGFNTGSYAEWMHLSTYIDPRMEVFFQTVNKEKDIYTEWVDMKQGHITYKDFLLQYGFDYLIVENTDILYTYLADDNDYEKVYEQNDGKCVVYRKMG